MKTEAEFRSAVAEEAITWIDTPYHASGAVKGVGVNCAQFLYRVAKAAGAVPADAPAPRWFTAQLATHSKEERIIQYIQSYGGVEISEDQVKTGDIVAYKSGQAHGHMALVLEYPEIIHVLPGQLRIPSLLRCRLGGLALQLRECFRVCVR
jgi:cell wall-associated NlpC family hydrolase